MIRLLFLLLFLLLLTSTLCTSFPVKISQPNNQQQIIIVAKDGSGDYTTVQAAVNSIPDGNKDWIEILIKPAKYVEHITIPTTKTFLKLIGDGDIPDDTVLCFDITTSTPNVSYEGSGAFVAYNDNLYAERLTFENTHGAGTQAIAVSLLGNQQQFKNCIIKGYQDTLFSDAGLQYFENCTIHGATDFIYGGGNALFEACTINNVGGGAVTAARTPQANTYGLTFLNCTLTAYSNVTKGSTYLGRTWGPYAAVDFLYTYEGEHINPVGWNNMGNPSYQPTVRLAEYKNYGPGSSTSSRVSWSSQLTDAEAANYTKQKILGNWNPL